MVGRTTFALTDVCIVDKEGSPFFWSKPTSEIIAFPNRVN
jgi:hypothetical protein